MISDHSSFIRPIKVSKPLATWKTMRDVYQSKWEKRTANYEEH